MSFRTRILAALGVVLALNTALVLGLVRARVSRAVGEEGRVALLDARSRAETALGDAADSLELGLTAMLARGEEIALLEESISGVRSRSSNPVVRAAERLRPRSVDLVRVLDARGVILSAAPDAERFGTSARTLAGLAVLPETGPFVRDIATDRGGEPALVAIRRTPSGLVLVAGTRLGHDFVASLGDRVGAEIAIAPAGGEWIGETSGGPVSESSVFGGELRLRVSRSDPALTALGRGIARDALVAGLGTLVLSFGIALVLARGLGRPIEALTRASGRIARGDLTRPVGVRGGGREIERLVGAFDAMRVELSETTGALRRAERRNAWQDAARRVAHEIKNALTPIRLAWERLGRVPGVETEAAAIEREIATLRRLVSEFEELGQWPAPRRRSIDLGDLARDVAELHQSAGRIRLQLADPGVAVTTADPGQLARAISNLITNALTAGGERGTVWIRTYRAPRGPAVAVRDDGSGMDGETKSRMFTPYFTTRAGGTGLGLSIVERIADAHGAELAVESAPGRGTAVSITFPEAPPEES